MRDPANCGSTESALYGGLCQTLLQIAMSETSSVLSIKHCHLVVVFNKCILFTRGFNQLCMDLNKLNAYSNHAEDIFVLFRGKLLIVIMFRIISAMVFQQQKVLLGCVKQFLHFSNIHISFGVNQAHCSDLSETN